MGSSAESTTHAATACAPLVKLLEYVWAITHKTCGLPDRFASIDFLSKLTLICSDTLHACLSQHLEDALLIPRRGIGWVLMQDQSSLGYLLAI